MLRLPRCLLYRLGLRLGCRSRDGTNGQSFPPQLLVVGGNFFPKGICRLVLVRIFIIFVVGTVSVRAIVFLVGALSVGAVNKLFGGVRLTIGKQFRRFKGRNFLG